MKHCQQCLTFKSLLMISCGWLLIDWRNIFMMVFFKRQTPTQKHKRDFWFYVLDDVIIKYSVQFWFLLREFFTFSCVYESDMGMWWHNLEGENESGNRIMFLLIAEKLNQQCHHFPKLKGEKKKIILWIVNKIV
jgi:hypothetical protein